MADLNALIAQGAQFAAPADPFAQYGKMQQLQQADSANQLNRMKMDEYQRGLQEEGGLRNFLTKNTDLTKPETRAGLLQFGKTGLAYAKSLDEQNTAAATLGNLKLAGVKTQGDVAELKRKLLDSSKRNMASNPSDENIIAHTQDYKLNPLFADDMLSIEATAQQLLAMPLDQRKLVLSGAGATAADLKPPAPPASVAEFERAQKDPKFMQFLQQRAAAGRAPATPSAPVAVIGPNGEEIFVSREEALSKRMTPASGGRLKPIPTQINQAIIKNVQTLKQLDDTIALLGKNPDATGYKGYLPNVVLSRVDPEGVDVRAGIADIGSLVLHERSGAAVTAAESPRLLPFIPLATDDNATAVKKLKRMREIAAADQLGLTETYGQDQGYKPNPLVSKPAAAPEAAPAIPTIYATNGKQRLQSIDGGKNWTPVK